MALMGNLKEVNLVSLIQMTCLDKKTAKLTFNYRGKIGVVYFDDGHIPHAQYDNLVGPDAIYRAIHLTEGEFKIEEGIRTNIKTNDIKWSELVLEGMRIYDESQVGQDEVHTTLKNNLLQIDGVLAVLILLKDGTPLANSDFEEVELYSNILSFFAGRLQSVGKNSGINYFNSAVLNFSDKVLLVYDRDPHIIGIFFNPQVNVASVEPLINKELQSYRNERL